ncbi:MAG TPA: hypothetical protein VLA92_02500 [Candidatus Saccharimonadales bacterium]|nr:hypothetical protein [Candidatus Saccharimonadales bacterium]
MVTNIRRILDHPQHVFVLLALSVMLPMLLPGYIFALDMSFTPHLRMPENITSSYPFYTLLHVLNWVLPSQLIQKAMLFLILFLSGWGAFRLIRNLQQLSAMTTTYRLLGCYVGGALYMINPFTYERFMTGQFAVLLGYALLPFFALCLLGILRHPTLKQGLVLGLWTTLIAILSIHTLGLLLVLVVTGIVGLLLSQKTVVGYGTRLGKSLAVSLGLFLALNSFWIIPLALGESSTAHAISSFTTSDQQAFTTLGSNLPNKVINVLQLQGFWAGGENLYLLPQEAFPLWGIAVIGLWVIAFIGMRSIYKQKQRLPVIWFGSAALVGIILATTEILPLLSKHIELLAGYREPQKFVGLLALAYAISVGFAIPTLLARYKEKQQPSRFNTIFASALVLPILLTPTMYGAFAGQLMPHNYPSDWDMINAQLNKDESKGRVLFLPWHLYMQFGFTGRITVNPAAQYFDKEVIVSNDLEYRNASPTVPSAEKSRIGKLLESAPEASNLGEELAKHNVKYVLLDHDQDWRNYGYLAKQKDLTLVAQTTNFDMYRNQHYREEE